MPFFFFFFFFLIKSRNAIIDPMERIAKYTRPVARGWRALRASRVPRDGCRRYMYNIWQPLTLLVLTVSFTVAFYATHDPYASTNPDEFFFCNANGKVQKTLDDYRPFWDPQLCFTINIAFGQFAFSTVKVIDASWDLVVGRGGQALAAVIAYSVLRRSFTLTMEQYTMGMSTVASLYCQQIQVLPVLRLVYNAARHRDLDRPTWKKPLRPGRLRLATQTFACVYVLSFATLASVMTGYRTQLTGYFGYGTQQPSQLLRISELALPRMAIFDAVRIGFPNTLFVSDAIDYPERSDPMYNEASFAGDEFLASTRHFEEPFGTLVDYYFTCAAIMGMRWSESDLLSEIHNPTQSLACAFHECSCSIPAHVKGPVCPNGYNLGCHSNMRAEMKSFVVLNGTRWDLSPVLDIEMARIMSDGPSFDTGPKNASDFWSYHMLWVPRSNRVPKSTIRAYTHDGAGFTDTTIQETGRCVAEGAYSWGFSSLLLLTFCIWTILFALTLIVLQTDVYWNSRRDRNHQSHSIYTDVLYLADELKAKFGSTLEGHVQSPKKVEKMVEQAKQGLNIDVSELRLSRWQEWQLSRNTRSTKVSTRGGILRKILPSARRRGNSLGHKLRRLSPQSDTQVAQVDTSNQMLGSEASFSSRLEAADPRSSSDGSAAVHAVVGTPASSMLDEQRLIANTTYEGT